MLLTIADKLNLIARIEDLANRVLRRDAGWIIRIPRSYGKRGIDIVTMWRKYHIAAWSYRIDGKHLIYTVKRSQAGWAEYLLCRYGCPPAGRFYHQPNARVQPGPLPTPWSN